MDPLPSTVLSITKVVKKKEGGPGSVGNKRFVIVHCGKVHIKKKGQGLEV
jgi:hypothetical protein